MSMLKLTDFLYFSEHCLLLHYPSPFQLKRRYLDIELPGYVSVVESKHIYTIWNFVAEFGGWVGIFLGFCVADIVDIVENIANDILTFMYKL